MSELRQARENLREHRDHLEEVVAQRTNELKATNSSLQMEIEDRKKAEEALRANEQRMKAILRASPVGIALVVNRELHWANETMHRMLGCEMDSLPGRNVSSLYQTSEEYERVAKCFRENTNKSIPVQVETQWARKDGGVIDCSIQAFSLDPADPSKGWIAAVTDVSDSKRLEAELQRAKKMEMVGTLAGGVAHDLNNILSGLVSYPELLLLNLPHESPLRKPIMSIKRSGEKAAVIVQDLLTMARRGVAVSEVVNLNDVISEQLESPELEKLRSFHPDIKVTTNLEKNLRYINGSHTHLAKSIMNLISNAAEAMLQGGTISISTKNCYLHSPIKGYDHVEEGEYATISVSDAGTGLSEEDRERVFEPFYTRKAMGRSGTGLGMAVVWGAVKDHNGYIDIQSKEGKGTTFTLFFPVTSEEPGRSAIPSTIGEYKGEGETILVVDDVVEQRRIASIILEKLGYTVSTVASGEEAVQYVKDNPVNLLILDMIMEPGMDGLDTYKKILQIAPGQKAIIASGFSETERVKEAHKLGAGKYIQKPYTLESIGLAIKETLKE
jgi:PAS domain S-box-containing protein